jgi:hypothetical protein
VEKLAIMRFGRVLLAICSIGLVACERRHKEVDHPFYLMFIEDPREVALFRCPNKPGIGCATDGLPGQYVVAAGADRQFVVVAQRSGRDNGLTRYYYFARVPQETSGWGNNPERIIGPLDEQEFAAAKAKLKLPDFTVKP